MEDEKDPQRPVSSWLELLREQTDEEARVVRAYYPSDSDDVCYVVSLNGKRVEVQVSRYSSRSPPTVISFVPRYLDGVRNHSGFSYLCVVLDVYGEDGFKPGRDHFIPFPELSETKQIRLRVLGPGSYSTVDDSHVNSWTTVTSGES